MKKVALGLLVVLAGCVTEPGEWLVRVDVVGRSFAAGATIPVDVVNSSEQSITFGACPFTLQRLEGMRWTSVQSPGPCIAIALGLPPDESMRMQFPMAARTSPGTYRLSYEFTTEGAQGLLKASSEAFAVR